MLAAIDITAAIVTATGPTVTTAVASARMIANTIIGTPAKCVAMLRRSRW